MVFSFLTSTKLVTNASSMCYFIILSLLFLSALPVAISVSFEMLRFEQNSSDILYQGDTKYSAGAIDLNDPGHTSRVGIVTYAHSVKLWDKSSGITSDFTTHFTFVIGTKGKSQNESGHGITFFIAPTGFQIPPNSTGGFLGLLNTTTNDSPKNQMIFVEFDSFKNPEWDPLNLDAHIGINENSMKSAAVASWNASLHSGYMADAWIIYNATTKNLSVFWSYKDELDFRQNSSLFYEIDLQKVIPEWVTIGFSASTGQFTEKHTLYSWSFNSSLESTGSQTPNRKVILAVVLSVVLTTSLIAAMLAYFVYQKRRQMTTGEAERDYLFDDEFQRGGGPRRFSYSELSFATQNFSSERKLGEGVFGAVYKGYLINLDIPVAVKKFLRGSQQGIKEYITEVKIISRLRHQNLVQLIGWCHDEGEFLLVYEFMSNGSLDSHLFGKKSPLPWHLRYKIATGLASGLLYLHEEWEQCVVHRDIKSSNVILDSNFSVKLGDFGLAKLMKHGLGAAQTTGLAGKLGYMAPEYISTAKASKESDVYSFGVVALEIATGRRVIDPQDLVTYKGLVDWVWQCYGKGELLSAIDEKVGADYDVKQAETLMVVGLWCAHPIHSLRPSIRQAIQVLHFQAALPSLPPKMPVATYHAPEISIATIGSSKNP